jgi:hypothetical protein
MKTLLLAAGFMAFATTSHAADAVSSTANGFAFGGDVTAQHNVDKDINTIVLTPEVVYTHGLLETTASSDLVVYNDGFGALEDTVHAWPTVDIKLSYAAQDNVELYVQTGYNFDTGSRKDALIGLTWSF